MNRRVSLMGGGVYKGQKEGRQTLPSITVYLAVQHLTQLVNCLLQKLMDNDFFFNDTLSFSVNINMLMLSDKIFMVQLCFVNIQRI